jgi:D-serine/D-alanine/glycine transporter
MVALLALEADTRKALVFVPVWFVVPGLSYRSIRRKKSESEHLSYEVGQ